MSALCGGIETGGTWTVCALAAGPEEIVAEEEFPTTSPEETLERIFAFFEAPGRPRPAAIGIGAFGPVDLNPASPTWGHVTTCPKPGWQGAALGPGVRDRFRLPVAFDTDVNAAALGEHGWGAGRGCGTLAYLTVGTGVGVGLLHGDRPWHGLIHPEAGHLRVPRHADDDFAGNCPRHGDCWEGMASGSALAERWGSDPAALPDDHPAWAIEVEYLAQGIYAVICVASPERFVVSGGVILGRSGLLPRVRARVSELNAGYLGSPRLGEQIDHYLVAPELGDRAGVLGAVALAQSLGGEGTET